MGKKTKFFDRFNLRAPLRLASSFFVVSSIVSGFECPAILDCRSSAAATRPPAPTPHAGGKLLVLTNMTSSSLCPYLHRFVSLMQIAQFKKLFFCIDFSSIPDDGIKIPRKSTNENFHCLLMVVAQIGNVFKLRIFKLDKNPPKDDFWFNNELRKKLECNTTKKISPRPYWFSPVAHWAQLTQALKTSNLDL